MIDATCKGSEVTCGYEKAFKGRVTMIVGGLTLMACNRKLARRFEKRLQALKAGLPKI